MRMVRKYLSNRERILLHLSTYSGELNYYNAPFFLTQDGIANAIGIGRNNVPRELKTLLSEGLVEAKKARVAGLKNRRTVYNLTSKGLMEAHKIRKDMEDLYVKVKSSSGEEELLLKEVPSKYGVNFISVALNLDKNMEVDLISIVRKKGKKIRFIEEDYVLSKFYGRNQELNVLKDWYRSNKRIMFITGLSGIGKTTLMLKFLKEYIEEEDVFFIKIDESSGALDIVHKLAQFLSKVGYPKLEKYLRGRINSLEEDINWSTIYLLMKESIGEGLYVFDNIESASKEVKRFFESLLKSLDYSKGFKLVFIGTGVTEGFMPLQIMKNAEELHLTELKEEEAYEMLRDEGFGEREAYSIIKKYGGNPLLLSIAKNQNPKMLRRFILDGVLGNLSEEERYAVEFMSVFRKPVKIGALLLNNIEYTAIYSLINKNILQELEFEVVTLHRIVRNFLYERLTKSKKEEYHLAAAKYLMEEGDILEAIYHFVMGGKILRANLLLNDYYEKYLFEKPGLVRSLAMEILNSYSLGIDDHEWLIYGIIGDTYFVSGEWDTALDYYRKGDELSRGKDEDYWVKNRVKIAEIVAKMGNYIEAKRILEEVLGHVDRVSDRKVLPKFYYVYGMVNVLLGNYDDAEEYLSEAFDLGDAFLDYRTMGYASTGLGILHRRRKDYKIAIEYFKKAQNYFEIADDKIGMIKNMINIAHVYYDLYDSRTEKYLLRAKAMLEKVPDKYIRASVLGSLGTYYTYREKWSLAEKSLKEAASILKEMNAYSNLPDIYTALGDVYAYTNRAREAKKYFDMALELAAERGDASRLKIIAKEAVDALGELENVDVERYKRILEGEEMIVTLEEK